MDSLARYAWLSLGVSVVNLGMKVAAYWVTNSVGLLTDAMESTVNVVAALLAVAMLRTAARPPDEDHAFGHEKAEYFSGGVEGGLIFVAAATSLYTSLPRFLHPQPLESLGTGLGLAVLASVLNLMAGLLLRSKGRKHKSMALEADAEHLLTDVWFSLGVTLGVALTQLTGWQEWDPLIGVAVAGYMGWVGVRLVYRAAHGLLDASLSPQELDQITQILSGYLERGVTYHALRTRRAGQRSFVQLHVLVPGEWSVSKGHELLEEIEAAIRARISGASVLTHLEPIEEACSFEDIELDRVSA